MGVGGPFANVAAPADGSAWLFHLSVRDWHEGPTAEGALVGQLSALKLVEAHDARLCAWCRSGSRTTT
jgi:hypothetical protein